MILGIVLVCIIQFQIRLANTAGPKTYNDGDVCLTGYMTDLQSWVARDGKLIVNGSDAIDLSHMRDVTAVIVKLLETSEKTPQEIRYMSLANCQLSQIPPIFLFQGALRVKLSESLKYLSFYGNNFGNFQTIGYKSSINATGATETISGQLHSNPRISWSDGLRNVTFKKMRQLDLRACRIETLNGFIFQGMPSLTHLYLGENEITFVEAHAFVGLRSITHLDLSRNIYVEEDNSSRPIVFESLETFRPLNLISLDFSYTPLGNRHAPMLSQLGNRLEILSLCHTAIFRLPSGTFSASPLKYLDVSENPNIISDINVLRGLENSLRVLYAHSTMLKSLNFLRNFTKLDILKVANNDIVNFPRKMMHTLESLQVLDLARNRISSWLTPIISTMPRLQLLSLKENNLNAVSKHMIDDMSHVNYLSLSKNSMTCHCFSREMYEIAFQNELKVNKTFLNGLNNTILYHTAYVEYNDMIRKRNNLTLPCLKMSDSEQKIECLTGAAINVTGDFLFLDYEVNDYSCFSVNSGKIIPQQEVPTCSQNLRDNRSPNDLRVARRSNLMLLAILLIILPITAFLFIYRRNLKYFLVTIRNSAMLSLINEKGVVDSETKIFNYDVFVSYCNEDRTWVLDHLLPHVEIDCNISVCLHERDFQVGLSILENIVSCMDRSRSIMLIISKRFLLSQWCQFEMHLAQHRLLETRREDLILILLEEIPRRLRPNTLHYLMLTKTYIVWPKEESESKEFWKRMKKSLVTQKLKSVDNDSLA